MPLPAQLGPPLPEPAIAAHLPWLLPAVSRIISCSHGLLEPAVSDADAGTGSDAHQAACMDVCMHASKQAVALAALPERMALHDGTALQCTS